jgi:DNA-binding MarR family transcriptional regulator
MDRTFCNIRWADLTASGVFKTVNKSRLTYRQYVVLTAIDEGHASRPDIMEVTRVDNSTCHAVLELLVAEKFIRWEKTVNRRDYYALTPAGRFEMEVAQRSEAVANGIILKSIGDEDEQKVFMSALQVFVSSGESRGVANAVA